MEFPGLDRRRSKNVTFGGKDRRENPPKFIDPPDDVPGAPKSPETEL